jgi:acetyl-CoA decarbonylase/synthase complex subunit gamma
MPLADAYLDRIDLLKYLPQTNCGDCGDETCEAFAENLKQGIKKIEDCPGVSGDLYYPFQIVLKADRLLPGFECLMGPQPGPVGLVRVNAPDAQSPILISGNHVHTQDVLASMLGTTRSPFFVLFVDTRGDTVDMAVVLDSLTSEGIRQAVVGSGLLDSIFHHEIVIPGLASVMGDELSQATGWKVRVGPVCAAELPLFFGDRWLPPTG